MAITKDDWGVKRVEKELAALRKAESRKGRPIEVMLSWILKQGYGWSPALDAKMKQLEHAKENWRLWTENPDYQIAIPDMVNGLAQVGLFKRRKK